MSHETGEPLKFFSRKNKDVVAKADRDPKKGRRFFEHAQAVADARNYDYAIDCYINGLRHEPDNMSRHEALYDVALKRKVGGGKAPGLTETLKMVGNDPVERMLHAEFLWAKDPLNFNYMLNLMERAVAADEADPDLHLGEVAFWVGSKVLEGNQSTRKPKISALEKLRDLFAAIGAYQQAVEACKLAMEFAFDDERERLAAHLKDLEAELTIKQSGLDQTDSDFRVSVRDLNKQRELDSADAITKTDDVMDENINNRKADYEASPQDYDKIKRYIEALLSKDDETTDNMAIAVLEKAFEDTKQYRFKAQIGDIKIKQFNRRRAKLKSSLEKSDGDETLRERYIQVTKQQAQFELDEYKERVQNYPTDMRVRFEYGKRLYQAKQYDDAIAAFQEAQADPKNRAASMLHLGSCYVTKGWFDEAITTFTKGIESHRGGDSDAIILDLRYLLMDTFERSARKNKSIDHAKQAQAHASFIIQANIKFRDIRERMSRIRELVDELQKQTT